MAEKKIIAVIMLAGIFLAGCINSQENQEVLEQETVQESRQYTIEEVKMHNSSSDCFMVVEEKVYDLTSYIAEQKHPGGEAIIQGCGTEATELFNNRPNDSGPHSQRARQLLADYYIGDLVK